MKPAPRMPFGKFRDQPLRALPDYYLTWLQDRCELREPLKMQIAEEQQRRLQDEPPPATEPPRSRSPQPLSPAVRAAAGRIVRVGFAALAGYLPTEPGAGSDPMIRKAAGRPGARAGTAAVKTATRFVPHARRSGNVVGLPRTLADEPADRVDGHRALQLIEPDLAVFVDRVRHRLAADRRAH